VARLDTRLLIALVLVATTATAQGPSILGPHAPAPPEGFPLAVQASSGAEVTVEGGALLPAPPAPPLRTFRVVPEPGARAVVVRVRDGEQTAERSFAVGPPASKVELSLFGGRAPVKGEDSQAELDVRVLDREGRPDEGATPPVLRANVGSIEGLTQVGPGHFRARYLLPPTRYPEVAVIVAFAPWPHPDAIHGPAGFLLLPLASAIELPGTSERNAQLTLEIAGRSFGPTTAGPDGRFRIPVVVPPGHRTARITARDPAGNARRSGFDLGIPPTDQLACVVNPRRLPADGAARARVVCATSDAFGAPRPGAKVELRLSAGQRSEPRPLGGGAWEWIITAPSKLGPPLKLEASWRDGRNVSRDELEVDLVQGPAAQVQVQREQAFVHVGGQLVLRAQAHDALGRPRAEATVVGAAPQGEVTVRPLKGPGAFELLYRPPADGDPVQTELSVRAFGPAGTEPANVSAWLEAGRMKVGVTDLLGWPVAGQRVRVDSTEVVTGPDGVADAGPATEGAHEFRHQRWPGLTTTLHVLQGGVAWPEGERPGSARAAVQVVVGPPLPVNIRFEIAGRTVTYWAEAPDGTLLLDRQLAHTVKGAEVAEIRRAGGRTVLELTGSGAVVGVRDEQTGVVGWTWPGGQP
jgi:hypothetical protein